MSFSFADGLAMSGLRLDAGVLSTTASSSSRGLQAEPFDGDDAAIHYLRLPRFHQKRDHRYAPPPHLHPADLSLGVAGGARFLLGFPQYAVVSLRVVTVAQDVILRSICHPVS